MTSPLGRVVLASPGGWDHVSTRDRLGAFVRSSSWPVEVIPFGAVPSDEDVARLVGLGGPDGLLLIQRSLPTVDQLGLLRAAFPRMVFDFDDALYAAAPDPGRSRAEHVAKAAARLVLRGSTSASPRARRLRLLLPWVDVCVAGNEHLARFARPHARRVEVIPTTAEPVEPPSAAPREAIVVWTGLSVNLQYLSLALPALRRLARETDYRLCIVSDAGWQADGVPVENVPWSWDAVHATLSTARAGLAPLTDNAWTRGKCARRALLYGAHALPAVASPVGVTPEIVLDGLTGFLVRHDDEWYEAVRRLLTEPGLAERLGATAWAHVRDHYSDQYAAGRWKELLSTL